MAQNQNNCCAVPAYVLVINLNGAGVRGVKADLKVRIGLCLVNDDVINRNVGVGNRRRIVFGNDGRANRVQRGGVGKGGQRQIEGFRGFEHSVGLAG